MKIVRLTENAGTTAFFDNVFNDEIELPPFSEVALSSVSVNTDPLATSVPVGSTLAWKRGVNSSIGTSLRPASYTSATYKSLFFDIEGNLNTWQEPEPESGDEGEDAGRQWAVSDKPTDSGFGKEGKVSIGYQTANYEGGNEIAYQHTRMEEAGQGLAAVYNREADGGNPGILMSSEPLGWGRSRFYANMNTITSRANPAISANGVYLGLSTVDHVSARTAPSVGDATTLMAIHVPYLASKAKLYGGENEEDDAADTGTDIAAGQIYGFEMSVASKAPGSELGKVIGVRYLADGTLEQLETADGPFEESYSQLNYGALGSVANAPLYPFVIFIGPPTNSKIDELQLSPDPYSLIANKKYPVITQTNGTRGMQNKGEKPIVSFDFKNSTAIGKFLGFSDSEMNTIKVATTADSATSHAFTADEAFGEGLAGQGFYVELMTGTCEGYDGQTGQRKNILAVIPESDSDAKILFQPSFPTFLEMNNSHPLVLRNIRARLLQTDGTPVAVSGLNSMTLLYKPGKSQ